MGKEPDLESKIWSLTGFGADSESYAALTPNDFDDQERNLTFVKTDFQVLKLKFLACRMKQAFYPLHKQNIARA